MKTTLLFVVVALVAILIVMRREYRGQIKQANLEAAESSRKLAELSKKLTEIQEAPSLELQRKCATDAAAFYKTLGYTAKDDGEFISHYNGRLKKCFVRVKTRSQSKIGNDYTFWVYLNVFDAVEGKLYGEYVWHTDKVKKYWEQPPMMCHGTTPDGEKKTCTSDAEFITMMAPYIDLSEDQS